MIEQEDNDVLTAAYLLGCHNTRKAYESRIKRYNHAVRREPYPMSRMYETAEGKYVQFEDYEALQQRLAAAESKNTELEKELFILASDVIYFENQTMPYEIVRKSKRVYDELCESEGSESGLL